MLTWRVGLQEQRLAYLDKQRTDTASQVALQAQLTAGLRAQVQGYFNFELRTLNFEVQPGSLCTLKSNPLTLHFEL